MEIHSGELSRPAIQLPPAGISTDISLAALTTIGIGGLAAQFARCESVASLRQLLGTAASESRSIFILGGGSNVLVSDAGFDGLVIRMEIPGIEIDDAEPENPLVIAGAGIGWDSLVSFCVSKGLQGIECLSGIPGSVGASPIQNIGAYGQEASETIEWVEVMDRHSFAVFTLPGSQCGFAYRQSRFKGSDKDRFVVVRVAFRLRRNDRGAVRYADLVRYFDEAGINEPTLLQTRNAVIEIRRRKAMVIDPTEPDSRSCGSFFMNPIVDTNTYNGIVELARREILQAGEKMPAYSAGEGHVKLSAAWLMEKSGLRKGTRRGDAALSSKHILAITNQGSATSAEVLALVKVVQESVQSRFGITLEPEPVFVG
jgi:UDP-N-acetylmuramate dehydrogenase